MTTTEPQITVGPPRYFMPVSTWGWDGWTFTGPMGYEEIEPEKESEAS